ncbi:MAG: LamG-like jellyroll fold domain-containing protein, partial [Planctomycetota bacterium]
SITAWIKPDPFCILDKQGACTDEYEFKDGFTGIIVNRTHSTLNPSEGTEAAALNFGGGNGFVYDGMLGYTWNDNASSTWNWNSDIFPVNREWNFVAVVIEPGKATCYMGDPNGVLLTATNAIAHTAEELDARTLIAGDIGHTRFYRGQMDDIRIYNYSLSAGQILGLAGIEGIVYVPLTSAADLIVGDKDPCYPDVDDQINFEDYTQLAKYWLEQHPWP